ncbi:putative enzyme of heme biosynthesis [Terriglobus roseus DSM 18391]|uniref:Putative enzyme of heme biosynthesis n=1 Tax=Terriglobus roseus (strain DSM 18391 / NRRL B-41598 / KBS 63) TaxID=926566 RepID=I3ZII6_TERRK|nr:tetratricopeptide repeat protein [Terriglobus roseus]AFL89054.1 putative enzyme of heme biosynthesis [Terriglobus roseus DSM 18391]
MESGRQYEREGKPREAAIQFSNAIRLNASSVDGHYELSKAYQESGSIQLAIYELGQVLQLAPANMNARVDVGRLLLQTGQTEAAAAQARWVVYKQPTNADAQALLSASSAASGNRSAAMQAIQAALALAPNRADFHTALGQLLAADPSKQPEAMRELQQAILLNSKDVSARFSLASILERRGDIKGAEQQMQEAILLVPQSVPARADLAALYIHAGDRAKAEATLQKATDDLSNDPAAAPLLERFYKETGNTAQAQQTYAALVQRHPGSLSLKLTYIRVLIDAGSLDRARPMIEDLVQQHETDPGVILLNAYLLMHDGKNEAALQLLQTASKNEPDSVDLGILLARAQDRLGDQQKAADTYRKVLRSDRSNLEAQSGLADLAYRRGDAADMKESARQMLLAHPNLADGYLWRGVANLQSNASAAAIADLEMALKLKPANGFALVQLGRAQAAQGNAAKAREAFEHALQLSPDPAAIAELTTLDVRAHQPAAAVQRVRQQLQRAPASAELYDQLAQAQLAAADTSSALASAKRATELDPDNRSAAQTFTSVILGTGQLAPAVDLWNRWAAAHPTDPQAPAALGMLYESSGDNKAALDFYRKSLNLKADQPEVSASIAALTAEAGGNLDVALSTAQAAYRARPASVAAADALGWIYYRKGLPASGLQPLQEAAALDDSDASVQYHLGVVLASLGRQAEAAVHLNRVATLAPGTPLSLQAQQSLAKLSGKGI